MVTYTRIEHLFQCPHCCGDLKKSDMNFSCDKCDKEYPILDNGQVDFRLCENKNYSTNFVIKPEQNSFIPQSDIFQSTVPQCSSPEVNWEKIQVSSIMTKALLSHFPAASSSESICLDLGCGEGSHKGVIEHAGFNWVGLDIDSEDAQILGDARSLPFDKETFEFVLSMAVLEHVSNPFVMIEQIDRVLETGGKFIGSVGFTETLHGDSHFHHSPLGVLSLLEHVGFSVDFIAPILQPGIKVHGRRLFPFPSKISSAVSNITNYIHKPFIDPMLFLDRVWYYLGEHSIRSEDKERLGSTRSLVFASHIAFVCEKY